MQTENNRSCSSVTHSYMIQVLISMSSELGRKLYICFQETGGQFGKLVTKQVMENTQPNVICECSRRDKMSTSLGVSWMKRVLQEVQDTLLLLLDSWSGQINSTLLSKAFPDSDIDLCIKLIPMRYCQPLDVYFFSPIQNICKAFEKLYKVWSR